ncbi:TonB-dependent receptor [Henriciella aquimarina]|uniref:TonB-dependent receptor n=1 Tax=Henriciella aquimarina TaxID=545261 RepID=UPI001F2414A2|nr:TonB-dependent receptor [Henriciella aquimarina]
MVTAACMAVVSPLPMLAQDGQPSGRVEEVDEPVYLDEVTVTSRFREESVQDIGVSVTGVSAETIREQGIQDIEDIARLVPGVQNVKSRQNSNEIAIRGVINSSDGERSTSALYSVFVDDVSVASAGTQRDYSSVDLNRIEVIRGPQPTLFGEGAVGGVLRYFTNDPDLDGPTVTGQANARLETIEDGGLAYGADNSTSFILSPGKLGVRVSGFYRKDEGFIDNPSAGEDVNDFDTYGGRAVLLAKPTDDLEIRLSAYLARDESGESTQIDPGSDPEDLTFAASPETGEFSDDFDLYSGKVVYDFGNLELTSITGYYERETNASMFSSGNSFGLVPFFATDSGGPIDTTTYQVSTSSFEQLSQEFRLVSDFDGPLNFTSGLYYRDRENTVGAFLDCEGCTAVTTPPTANLATEETVTESEHYSGFVELTYEALDNLRFIGGARYVNDTVEVSLIENEAINLAPRFDGSGAIIPWTPSDPIDFASTLDILNGAGFGTNFEFEQEKVLPRIGVEYDVNEDILLYVNAAEGARNGGVSQAIAALSNSGGDPDVFYDNLTFDEDSVLTIEGGVKSTLMNGRLTANFGLFHSKYEDTQILVSLPATNVTNGPDQRIIGAELETAYRFSDELQAFLNASIIDSEFSDDFSSVLQPPPGETAPYYDIQEGNEVPQAPSLSFSTGYSYSRPLGTNGMRLTSNGSFQYIGERYSSVQNYPASELDSLEILNLRVGLEKDAWALNLFATNLLNDLEEVDIYANSLAHYINDGGTLDADPIGVNVNRPRTVGLSLTLRY